MEDVLAGCIVAAIIIALIIFGPLITIWAINLLFGLTIPMNIGTWFASFWLSGASALRFSPKKN